MKEMNSRLFRKIHRYLGVFIGIQFLFWTISGLYFSWTNLDEIHGDHFKVLDYETAYYTDFIPLSALQLPKGIQSIELREINEVPYYWINNKTLFNAETGIIKNGVTESEALSIAKENIKSTLNVRAIELITQVGKHNEYRERPLPAYVISYDNQNKVKAYVSKMDGKFQHVPVKGFFTIRSNNSTQWILSLDNFVSSDKKI